MVVNGSTKKVSFFPDYVKKSPIDTESCILFNEVSVYKAAVLFDEMYGTQVADFFCKTWESEEKDGSFFQEKVDITLPKYNSEMAVKIQYGKNREIYKTWGFESFLFKADCCVLYWMIASYGIKNCLDFANFVETMALNDLFFYNAGFKDGKVKFFDFAGYREE